MYLHAIFQKNSTVKSCVSAVTLSQTPRGEPHYRLHTAKGISVNLQEQDKSSDIEQQPPFGDRKISTIITNVLSPNCTTIDILTID